MVDATPACKRIQHMKLLGYANKHLAEIYGISRPTILRYARGEIKTIHPDLLHRILTTPPPQTTMRGRAGLLVPCRQVRALQAVGYTIDAIADATGISHDTINKISLNDLDYCRPSTAEIINARFWPLARAVENPAPTMHARSHRWKNPWQWNDITDPAEHGTAQGMISDE